MGAGDSVPERAGGIRFPSAGAKGSRATTEDPMRYETERSEVWYRIGDSNPCYRRERAVS